MRTTLLESSLDTKSVSQHRQWNSITTRLVDCATIAFLLLQLPQIILNTQNLLAGNFEALFAVQWMGQLTGLLGNLSLLSYFAGKRERGAMGVQTVGVLTTLVVLAQLFIARAMPLPVFVSTVITVSVGLLINLINYFDCLHHFVWKAWKEGLSIGGAAVLAQVMWSTFVPYIPSSYLPGTVTGTSTFALVIVKDCSIVPQVLTRFTNNISGWTATLLFMWTPVAQMWQNFLDPEDIHGLSVVTIMLSMVGNGLLLPRALFTRDLMWFTGAAWGTLVQGWGILFSMYITHALSMFFFLATSVVLASWIVFVLIRDSRAYLLPRPWTSLVQLVNARSGGVMLE